jgi:hypothetical protein
VVRPVELALAPAPDEAFGIEVDDRKSVELARAEQDGPLARGPEVAVEDLDPVRVEDVGRDGAAALRLLAGRGLERGEVAQAALADEGA